VLPDVRTRPGVCVGWFALCADTRRLNESERDQAMSLLKWALIMLVVSLVAALFGFTDLAAASADVARILFYIFLVIFLVLLVLGFAGARAARGP
jgi:uncharacterized membrane protein YtjA (UPF0391 family)